MVPLARHAGRPARHPQLSGCVVFAKVAYVKRSGGSGGTPEPAGGTPHPTQCTPFAIADTCVNSNRFFCGYTLTLIVLKAATETVPGDGQHIGHAPILSDEKSREPSRMC